MIVVGVVVRFDRSRSTGVATERERERLVGAPSCLDDPNDNGYDDFIIFASAMIEITENIRNKTCHWINILKWL